MSTVLVPPADTPEALPNPLPIYGCTSDRPRRFHRPALRDFETYGRIWGRVGGEGCGNPLTVGSLMSNDLADLPPGLEPCGRCFADSEMVARAERINAAADETDDARDHDELHAAADIVRTGFHSRYVDRWVEELEKRWGLA